MRSFPPFRIVLAGLLLAACTAIGVEAAPQAGQQLAQADGAAAKPVAGGDLAQSRNAARSRMRECGHQWSNMKKNGAAAGMTWKEFSQGCLAKQ